MLNRYFYKIDKIILSAIFVLIIYIPLIAGILQEDQKTSGTEKRNLTTLPDIPASVDALIKFPKAFNQYYSDHFGFREKLTRAYFKNVNRLGKQSSIDDVTFGQDDWLFLGSMKPGYTGYNDPIGDAMNVNLFSDKELEDFAGSITAIKNWLKNKGIEYILVIAPNKHTIYFEKLPKYITKKNRGSATDQLITHLQENTDITVVDLRQALLAEKKKHHVYYKSDTHWNHYGANVAQYEIMNTIENIFPDRISPSFLSDSQFELTNKNNGDLAKFANIESFCEPSPQPVFEGPCNSFTEKSLTKETRNYTTTCNRQKLKAVIFRDSFFTALQPYFSNKFLQATYVWERINHASLVNEIDKNQPDIVIDEVVERSLPYIPANIQPDP